MATTAAASAPKCTNMSRVTRGGRKLTYQLQVIQQPERARACGSGAKSSADRRPVDPPPVVELRIFEGDNDVTFSLNANFFLYATLEAARPIAQGRVQTAQPQSPILTGFPVSSMAYLDRPVPAGYFIFPDLSVRHEGKYKLAFNLYEEVKESADFDAQPAHNHPDHPANKTSAPSPHAPKEHFHWRLEVQSNPFTVFSAKKFPGLAESTALSRIVAEQGCRVRIRRDVRMRRRETKAGKDYEEYDEEQSYSQDAPAPDMYHGAVDRRQSGDPAAAPYAVDRRASAQDPSYYQQPQQPPPQQPQPHAAYQSSYPPAPAPTSHQSYGGPTPAQPQYTAPQYHADQRTSGYTSNQYQYSAPQPSHSLPPSQAQAPNQSYGYPDRHNSYSSAQYQSQPAPVHGRGESIDHKAVQDWRSTVTPHQPSFMQRPSSLSYSQQPIYHSYGNMPVARTPTPSGSNALPPLKPLVMPSEPKFEAAPSPSAQSGAATSAVAAAAPLPSPNYDHPSSRMNSYSQYTDAARSGKRSFNQVFESSHFDQSLANGSRPNESQYGADVPQPSYDEDEYDSAYDISQLKMQYKRADGTEISRRLTALS